MLQLALLLKGIACCCLPAGRLLFALKAGTICTYSLLFVSYRNDPLLKRSHFGITILLLSRSAHKIIQNGFICHALGKIETI